MTLHIRVLGGLAIAFDDAPLPRLAYRKAEALLVYLVAVGRPVSRDVLATLLWSDRSQERALNNLRVLLSQLRSHVNDYLDITRQTVAFRRDQPYTYDVEQLDRASRLASPSPTLFAELEAAAEAYRGDFLEGFYVHDAQDFDGWVDRERDRLRQRYVELLEHLIALDLEAGRASHSLIWSDRLLVVDPFHEPAHRQRMRALAVSGQAVAAVLHYERWRDELRREIGSDPTAETTQLYEQIRDGVVAPPTVPASAFNTTALVATPTTRPRRATVPDIDIFYGRDDELEQLATAIADERNRVVVIVGMGGIGKTSLAARFAHAQAPAYDHVLWRSLLNAPPLADVLLEWIVALDGQDVRAMPSGVDERLAILLDHVAHQRVLLVLDNMESILVGNDRAGTVRAGYEDYLSLVQRFAEIRHESRLLVTTRENPLHALRLGGVAQPIEVLSLRGLTTDAARAIFAAHAIDDDGSLAQRYSGNPLALHLIATTIRDIYAGDTSAFLRHDVRIFDDIRDVLDVQFARLVASEAAIIYWLAMERAPMTVEQLQQIMRGGTDQRGLLEALRSLRRRSLIEQQGATFFLQNVLTEYATDRLLETLRAEIEQGALHWFGDILLQNAQSREYVRQTQKRLLVVPLAAWLRSRYGANGAVATVDALLGRVRSTPVLAASYAATNLVHLLISLDHSVRGYDFSGLALRRADLRGVQLVDADLRNTSLDGSTFVETFQEIYKVKWSPRGDLVAGSSVDGSIWLWRVADSGVETMIVGDGDPVYAFAWNPQGTMIVSGSLGGAVKLWNAASGALELALAGHTLAVWDVAFSPDGATMASVSDDCSVAIWDVSTGERSHSLLGHANYVVSVVWNPTHPILVSGCFDGTIRVWDTRDWHLLGAWELHASPVASLSWSADGLTLASAGWDQTVRTWTLDIQPLVVVRHRLPVTTVAFDPSGTMLASCGDDRVIQIWDARSGGLIRSLHGHEHTIQSLSWSIDSTMLVSSSGDLTVRFWDINTGLEVHVVRGYAPMVRRLHFTSDGTLLVGERMDRDARLWRAASPRRDLDCAEATGKTVHMLKGHTTWVSDIDIHDGANLVATASWDQTVRLWNLQTGAEQHVLRGNQQAVIAVVFNNGGTQVASGGWDHSLRIWNTRDGKPVWVLRGHTDRVTRIAWHQDDRIIASSSWDKTIRIWDTTTGRCVGMLEHRIEMMIALFFVPDTTLLVSVGDDNVIAVYDYERMVLRERIDMLQAWKSDVFVISPDGRLIATGNEANEILLLDVATQTVQRVLDGHTLPLVVMAFDGRGLLASSATDGMVKVWDIADGRCVQTLRAPRPYDGMNIAGAQGLSLMQRQTLRRLGALERP